MEEHSDMNLLIIGAAGMLGGKLAARLATLGELDRRNIERLTLVDIVTPQAPQTVIPTDCSQADLSSPGTAEHLVASRPDVIFHLAAIVSGEAEADFETGYRINLDATRALLEAIRLAGDDYCPRVVFASSIAVFGAPFPERIGDEFRSTPLTSYGTQKRIGELLLADYTRRGLLDGIGLRLPTICVRPGKPNRAASGFFSNILREPIHGKPAVLPVADTVRHWFASPRAAIGFLVQGAELDGSKLGHHRILNLPGLSATVAEQIDALGRIVGSDAVALIKTEPDPAIDAIVANWPENFDPQRAISLGFRAETRMDDIIEAYLQDDFPLSNQT